MERCRRMVWWLGVFALVLLAGCGGDGPSDGGLVMTFAWPASQGLTRSFAGMKSLKIELTSGQSSPAPLIVNRPTVDNQSSASFPALAPSTYVFLVTAYDAANAGGAILGQARGRVTVAAGVTQTVYLTTVQAAQAQLIITPLNLPVYVHRTLQLTATMTNPDNAVVVLPASQLQWTSSVPAYATISAAGGMLTGVAEGDTTVTVTNGLGLSAHATYTVLQPPPTVMLTANKTQVAPGDAVTLTWASTDADAVLSSTNFNTSLLSGTLTVYPTETTTYRLTVDGAGGTATYSVTVTVNYPVPTVSLTASSTTISAGNTVKLTWSSAYAFSVTEAYNFNTTALNGEITLAPTATTTYRITVKGPGGSKSSEVTVTVQ